MASASPSAERTAAVAARDGIGRGRRALGVVVLLLLLAVAWEGAKWLAGDPWRIHAGLAGIAIDYEHVPPFQIRLASDLNLPHLWTIAAAFAEPAQRNGPPLLGVLVQAAAFTFLEAAVGFAIGAVLGLVLAIVFVHVRLLERSLVPYVVASQTVPIIAVAPVIVVGLKAGWFSVALIASYLTFFPVTMGALRGLRAADPRTMELMRSYAAGTRDVLLKLRLPAAAPYIFTALKVSATASVVGAIIGELPSSIRSGLGGAILNLNQYYATGPARLWAAILVAAALGILFFTIVWLVERWVLTGRYRPEVEPA